EWSTTASNQSKRRHHLAAFLLLMWRVPLIALVIGAFVLIWNPAGFIHAAPFLMAWLVSPFVAYWVNGRMLRRADKFDEQAEVYIRRKARRAWRDLSRLDNNGKSQSFCANQPRLRLWTLAMHGLGCSGVLQLAERLESTFATTKEPEDFHCNHDISRDILEIENGDLTAHLRTFTRLCSEVVNQPLVDERVWRGLADTVALMKEQARRAGRGPASQKLQQLYEAIGACAALFSSAGQKKIPPTLSTWCELLTSLAQHASVVQ